LSASVIPIIIMFCLVEKKTVKLEIV